MRQNLIYQRFGEISLIIAATFVLAGLSHAGFTSPEVLNRASSRTLRSMARIYMAHGNYSKSQPLLEQALHVAVRDQAEEAELALCKLDLATLYTDQGKFDEALDFCLRGLELQRKALYPEHPYVAFSMRTLSRIYRHRQKKAEALQTLDEAIEIMLTSHLPGDVAFVPFQVEKAELLTDFGQLEQASKILEEAMAVTLQSYGENHLYTASVLEGMGQLEIEKGYPQKAEQLIDLSLDIKANILGKEHYLTVGTLLTKAKALQIQGLNRQAEALTSKALHILEQSNIDTMSNLQQRAETIHQKSFGPVARAD